MGAGSAREMRRSGPCWLVVFCALGVWSTGPVAGSEMTCVSCPTGQYLEYVSEDEMRCRTCPANSHTPSAANATSVLDCECEAAHTSSSRICEECELGTFKPEFGNVSCTVCQANTNTTAPGRSAASDCLCVPGFYLPEIPYECVPCAPGHFKGTITNDECAQCVEDTFCPEQTSVPLECLANSASAKGSVALSDCQCLPGFFLDYSVGYECVQCAVGTYKVEQGPQACTLCPADTYNPELGSLSPTACEPCDPAARAPQGSSAVGACLCSLGYSGEPGSDCEA